MKKTKTNDVHLLSPFGGRGALFFLFFLPLWGLGGSSIAQVSVTITGTTYSASTPQASCIVSWTATSSTPHNNKIWVIADYVKVEGASTVAPWSRATVTAVSKTAGAGTVSTAPEANNLGFWITTLGGNGSATVTATLGLPAGVAQFNWCAYAFDYPPHAVLQSGGSYQLHGTKPFRVNDADLAASTVYSGDPPITAFTDATDCPGIVDSPTTNQNQGSCTFTQPPVVGTFAAFPSSYSASTFVTLTDERDGNNYTVVKIGNKWIMAQNLNYQTGLTWQTNSNMPSTGSGKNTALIGHFWCPGGNSSQTLTSTLASCDVWGALYSWETALMRDGRYAGADGNTSTTWPGGETNCELGPCTNNAQQGGRGICPPNWHVPTDAEWGGIFNGMESAGGTSHSANSANYYGVDAGARAKANCVTGVGETTGEFVDDSNPKWYFSASASQSDAYNFRALPAGYRFGEGARIQNRGLSSTWWSASNHGIVVGQTWTRELRQDTDKVVRTFITRSTGASVRCIAN